MNPNALCQKSSFQFILKPVCGSLLLEQHFGCWFFIIMELTEIAVQVPRGSLKPLSQILETLLDSRANKVSLVGAPYLAKFHSSSPPRLIRMKDFPILQH